MGIIIMEMGLGILTAQLHILSSKAKGDIPTAMAKEVPNIHNLATKIKEATTLV